MDGASGSECWWSVKSSPSFDEDPPSGVSCVIGTKHTPTLQQNPANLSDLKHWWGLDAWLRVDKAAFIFLLLRVYFRVLKRIMTGEGLAWPFRREESWFSSVVLPPLPSASPGLAAVWEPGRKSESACRCRAAGAGNGWKRRGNRAEPRWPQQTELHTGQCATSPSVMWTVRWTSSSSPLCTS